MREAVDQLHLQQATALEELQQFEGAMSELWRAIATVAASIDVLAAKIRAEDELDQTRSGESSAVVNRALQVATTVEQVALALGEICRGVRAWSIADRAIDGEPRSLLATPVPRS